MGKHGGLKTQLVWHWSSRLAPSPLAGARSMSWLIHCPQCMKTSESCRSAVMFSLAVWAISLDTFRTCRKPKWKCDRLCHSGFASHLNSHCEILESPNHEGEKRLPRSSTFGWASSFPLSHTEKCHTEKCHVYLFVNISRDWLLYCPGDPAPVLNHCVSGDIFPNILNLL